MKNISYNFLYFPIYLIYHIYYFTKIAKLVHWGYPVDPLVGFFYKIIYIIPFEINKYLPKILNKNMRKNKKKSFKYSFYSKISYQKACDMPPPP